LPNFWAFKKIDLIFTLHQILEQTAVKFPKKEAFRFLDQSISFEDLNCKSNQLADYLIKTGLQKSDRVGIYMNRCLETTIAVYGILKSGGVYVPLDPFAPYERTKTLIKDCGINHIVTTEKQSRKISKLIDDDCRPEYLVGALNDSYKEVVDWGDIFRNELENYHPPKILEQDLAYILYTSGSTGVPKGIMHTHYSAVNFAKLVIDLYQFNADDKIGITAPLHFDPSTLGYFSAPLVGATSVIVPDMHLKLAASLAELIEKEQLTVWFSVPLILIQLLQKGGIEKRNYDSLRWILFSGEVFPTKHLRSLMSIWTNKKYSNIYGPTEVNQCTYYNLETPPVDNKPIPIGYVWGNTEYKILNEQDEEVPKGEQGLLVIRSGTMMKGYWKNKELTEKSLYKTTIIPGLKATYYRTGDLVSLNDKGELLFFGRKDRQIKIRGFRLEIDEIENTLVKHPEVDEAAVTVMKDENEDEKLIAAVLLKENGIIDIKDLVTLCKKSLPNYAVPSIIKIMSSFPRTSTGKINRREIAKIITES